MDEKTAHLNATVAAIMITFGLFGLYLIYVWIKINADASNDSLMRMRMGTWVFEDDICPFYPYGLDPPQTMTQRFFHEINLFVAVFYGGSVK